MTQPELGRHLVELRKCRNLTQEELVEKSHVSVRTIQRIESGEVMPRMSTVKILLEALGETIGSISTKPDQVMEVPMPTPSNPNRNVLLTAALAGGVYLFCQICLGVLDVLWMMEDKWELFNFNIPYILLTIIMAGSYFLFARGFIALSKLFENSLLKQVTIMLIITTTALGILDIATLGYERKDDVLLLYIVPGILLGAVSIAFGIALIRLQDSMGELSRVAGVLEIIAGFLLVTVVLFFFWYVVMIPAVIVEIFVLYRGYEYVSGARSVRVV